MTDAVHRTHCCAVHGCKYGDVHCPVETGKIAQDYPCDLCKRVLGSPTLPDSMAVELLKKMVDVEPFHLGKCLYCGKELEVGIMGYPLHESSCPWIRAYKYLDKKLDVSR